MFCSQCGQKLSHDALFCSKCGNSINSTSKEDASILTGKVSRKTKLSALYIISIFVMGGLLIPIFMMLALAPKLHTSASGFMMASPFILYILGYGIAVLAFSHFFSTTMVSRGLVKITFVSYLVGFILMAINIPFLLFAFASIDANMISDMWPGKTSIDHEIITSGDKRIQVLLMIIIALAFMASYALIDLLLLRRWLKNDKGLTLKEGLRSIFKPKFNKEELVNTFKSLK
jgi:hypothetical protein